MQNSAFVFCLMQDPDVASKEPSQYVPEVRVVAPCQALDRCVPDSSLHALLAAEPRCGPQGPRIILAGDQSCSGFKDARPMNAGINPTAAPPHPAPGWVMCCKVGRGTVEHRRAPSCTVGHGGAPQDMAAGWASWCTREPSRVVLGGPRVGLVPQTNTR
jgi:hypothetical protein